MKLQNQTPDDLIKKALKPKRDLTLVAYCWFLLMLPFMNAAIVGIMIVGKRYIVAAFAIGIVILSYLGNRRIFNTPDNENKTQEP